VVRGSRRPEAALDTAEPVRILLRESELAVFGRASLRRGAARISRGKNPAGPSDGSTRTSGGEGPSRREEKPSTSSAGSCWYPKKERQARGHDHGDVDEGQGCEFRRPVNGRRAPVFSSLANGLCVWVEASPVAGRVQPGLLISRVVPPPTVAAARAEVGSRTRAATTSRIPQFGCLL